MDASLLRRIDCWLEAHRAQIVADLVDLVRIPSVSVPSTAFPPYGKACRDALAFMEGLARRYGYAYRNYDHYIGAIRLNPGDTEIAFWSHLDVVPVPDPGEWDYPPFEGRIVEDRYIIGRGVQDNKSTAIGILHAHRCLRELGVPLRHGYALYLGTSEETGMEDVRYFLSHYPAPDLSIVPDCGFPVCIAQRGAMRLQFALPFPHALHIDLFNNPSVTPESLRVRFADQPPLTVTGESTHVYLAEHADNAIVRLFELLAARYPDQAGPLLRCRSMLGDWRGGGLGISVCDALSGPLCAAPTRIQWQDGRLLVDLYCILPVQSDPDALIARAEKSAGALGMEVRVLSRRNPVSFPADHPVVHLLTDTYNRLTGLDAAPFVMSGGNYAAYLPNPKALGR